MKRIVNYGVLKMCWCSFFRKKVMTIQLHMY